MHAASRPDSDSKPGSAIVFSELKKAIVDGGYEYGERLPSERKLSEIYGVARNTIRLVLQRLDKARLVEHEKGKGTYVSFDNTHQRDNISEEISPLELIETRLAIEPHIVKLVVRNASNRDLQRLEQSMKQLERANESPNEFSIADESFHIALAQCSQNPLLIWVSQLINHIRSQPQWSTNKEKILTLDKIAEYNRQHRELLDVIKQRDPESASRIVAVHLTNVKNDLLGTP